MASKFKRFNPELSHRVLSSLERTDSGTAKQDAELVVWLGSALVVFFFCTLFMPLVPELVSTVAACLLLLGSFSFFTLLVLDEKGEATRDISRLMIFIVDSGIFLLKIPVVFGSFLADLFLYGHTIIFGSENMMKTHLWQNAHAPQSSWTELLLRGALPPQVIQWWALSFGVTLIAMMVCAIPGIGIPVLFTNALLPALEIQLVYFLVAALTDFFSSILRDRDNLTFQFLSLPYFVFLAAEFAYKIAASPIYYVLGIGQSILDTVASPKNPLTHRLLHFIKPGTFNQELLVSGPGFIRILNRLLALGILNAVFTPYVPVAFIPILCGALVGVVGLQTLEAIICNKNLFGLNRITPALQKPLADVLDITATLIKLPFILLTLGADVSWRAIRFYKNDYRGLFARIWNINSQAVDLDHYANPCNKFFYSQSGYYSIATLVIIVLLSVAIPVLPSIVSLTPTVTDLALSVCYFGLSYYAIATSVDTLAFWILHPLFTFLEYGGLYFPSLNWHMETLIGNAGVVTYLPLRIVVLASNFVTFSLKLGLSCLALPLDLIYNLLHVAVSFGVSCCYRNKMTAEDHAELLEANGDEDSTGFALLLSPDASKRERSSSSSSDAEKDGSDSENGLRERVNSSSSSFWQQQQTTPRREPSQDLQEPITVPLGRRQKTLAQ